MNYKLLSKEEWLLHQSMKDLRKSNGGWTRSSNIDASVAVVVKYGDRINYGISDTIFGGYHVGNVDAIEEVHDLCDPNRKLVVFSATNYLSDTVYILYYVQEAENDTN